MRESLRRLREQGCEVQVIAPSWKGLRSHAIDGMPVHRFRYAPASLEILTHDEGAPSKLAKRPWMQLLAIPYILLGAWMTMRICWKWRPTVIHAHWPFPHALLALPSKWLFGIPLVLNFHGAELLLTRKHRWLPPVFRFLIGHSDAILANSSFTAAKIRQMKPCQVELSPYGTTLSATPPAVKIASKPFVALFVGRHIERKGIDVLIHAAALLDPQKYQVRIVGHGDLTESLQTLARQVAPQQVVFTGKLSSEELAREYADAGAFVLPAVIDSKGDTEGLGVVLIEAAEMGLPLVASDVGGIPDVVQNETSGLLVPPKNCVALANAIQRLVEEPGLSEKLCAGAHRQIAECFSWSKIIDQQKQLYVRLGLRR